MFVTFDHYKWPLLNEVAPNGERTWRCADIYYFDLWFLLHFYQTQEHRGKQIEGKRSINPVLPLIT
ncbi:MAG: hypothetical protein CFE43_21370 [Burkholderiales bacterium PBB3]|nr:MAG: hypothetical protein CFE43_21370 [Burkholderiales bacterium PBB3]